MPSDHRTIARGTFEVRLEPQPVDFPADAATLGRLTIHKSFRGDLSATSVGQMLTATTTVEGSAGYVAMELVNGTLGGRDGSFALQHTGTMKRGRPELLVTVVPDSATGELTGLAGTLVISVTNGSHSYEFAYTLAGGQ